MWSALLPFLLQFSLQSCVLGDGTYECGDHGRFEYCIDEIPGCVIGCHCHPGYYFDTDTKICEPNSKLIEHHRRNNLVNPARVQTTDVTPNVFYDTEPASSTNAIETQVDDIAKDANDLGDWLYNQFFKTIENQVINNTNDKDILNRRSGSQPPKNKPKRSKKWRKSGKSKQKGKKEQLRRKLLRITENDSLFDISSTSSSDSSDSSSSGDLTSREFEVNEDTHHKHDDDQHGHKKIVMINKKPKQPLPSFIFLPNLETPFYPPIGLPPPPIVPMYPMVPVPPVPLCPITGCIENADNNVATNSSVLTTNTVATSATTSVITTTSAVTSVPSSTSETSAGATDANQTTDEPISDPKTDTKALRLKRKKKKKAAKLSNSDIADTKQWINNLNYIDRKKILAHLKEKMGNPSAKLSIPSWKKNKKIYTNKFVNQNTELENPFFNNGIVDGEFSNNERNPKPMEEDGSFPDNVDFKYITELIHHVDPNNKSNDLPPIEYNPLDNMYQSPKIYKNEFSDYSVPFDIPDGRRMNRPMHHKSDESYYTNLGRQIATMIRGLDTKENVELQETQSNIKNDPYFKNNSPTSFWERSVRSPLTYLKTKNKKFEYLKKSNELLFDIENKVEILASTVPSLTLQEIENIVKVMEAAKSEIQSKNKPNMKNPESALNKNLNVDLWPQKSHDSMYRFKNSIVPYSNKIGPRTTGNSYKPNKNNIAHPNELTGVRIESSQKVVAWNGKNNIKPINQTRNILTAKPAFQNNYFRISPTSNHNLENSNIIHKIPAITNSLLQNTIYSSFLNQPKSPYFLHHRKYFQDNNNNYYVSQNVELPQVPQVVKITPVAQPSYFSD